MKAQQLSVDPLVPAQAVVKQGMSLTVGVMRAAQGLLTAAVTTGTCVVKMGWDCFWTTARKQKIQAFSLFLYHLIIQQLNPQ